MVHIFHVHSYINYIVALGVIESESLKFEDVYFLLFRGIKPLSGEHKYLEVDDEVYSFPFTTLKKLKSLKFLKSDLIINKVDQIIKVVTNAKPFIYYSPNSKNYIYRVFISNKYCVGINYIEDGLDMYLDKELYSKKYPDYVPLIQKISHTFFSLLIKKNRRIKPFADPFRNHQKYQATLYGISDKSFKSIAPNKKMKMVIPPKNIDGVDLSFSSNFDSYILLDAVVEQKVIPEKLFLKFIEDLVNYIETPSVAIKFHPFQGERLRLDVVRLIEKTGKTVYLIDDNVPFEVICFTNVNYKIYGIGSSLLNYASLSGTHKVYVFYPYFQEKYNYRSSRKEFWVNSFKKNLNVKLFGRDFS